MNNNHSNHMYSGMPPHSQPPGMSHDAHQQYQQQQPQHPQQSMSLPQPHQGLPAVGQPPYPMGGNQLPSMQYGDPYNPPHQLPEHAQATSPAEDTKPSPEDLRRSQDALRPRSETLNGWTFSLEFIQQPKRARMCGFGDKDRRPITPPPCVRLIIIDSATGKEVDCNEIDHSLYVLNVDLWSSDALKEVNLVRHTTSTPSISSTTSQSFASLEQIPAHAGVPGGPMNPGFSPGGYGMSPSVNPYGSGSAYGQGPYGGAPNGYPPHMGYMQGQPAYPRPDMYAPPPPGMGYPGYRDEMGAMVQRGIPQPSQPSGMFTRNLIGSLSASAFRLTDPQERIGIWFILHDLSVRTEGDFRLRASFVDVKNMSPNGSGVNQGKANVLASVYSDQFTVYSAKKFPGVCESTALSKCFAGQGIKIPIRKDGNNGKGDDGDDFD